VIRIVGSGTSPIPIEDDEIIALQAVVASSIPTEPCRFYTVGQTIRLIGGPLAGLPGTIIRYKPNKYRLIISISLLQRSIMAEVEDEWIEPDNPNLPT
jgi:transcription antitermination factor NusG